MGRVTRDLAALCLAGAVLAGGCGGGRARPAIPAAEAAALAARADQVAADVAAGACDRALAEARSLAGDLAAVPADPAVRAEALSRATRLVAAIDCPPPATTTTTGPAAAPPPAGGGPGHGKGNGDGHGHGHDD